MDLGLRSILDHLITALRGGNVYSSKELVDRSVFYLPSVRNVNNVGLLLGELLFSKEVFKIPGESELRLISHLYDGFYYSIDRKARITDPLISFSSWIQALLDFSRTVVPEAQWKTIPVVAAIAKFIFSDLQVKGYIDAHRQAHKDLVLEILNESVGTSWLEHRASVILCLARSQPEFSLPHNDLVSPEEMLGETAVFLYDSPDGIQTLDQQSIGFQVFNGFSFLIRDLIVKCPLEAINEALTPWMTYLLGFSEKLSYSKLPESFSKISVFGILLQFEGLATVILQKVDTLHSLELAKNVLFVLNMLNGFVISIGKTGFEQYNYIYYLCVDVLLAQPSLVIDSALNEYIGFSKQIPERLVFTLDLLEETMNGVSNLFLVSSLLPFTTSYLKPLPVNSNYSSNVLESAHAVMLKVLIRPNCPGLEEVQSRYFDTVTDLFPGVFDSRQFILAVTNLAANMPAHQLETLLQRLFSLSKSTLPGISLPASATKVADEAPTVRAALVHAFLKALPNTRPEQFRIWLEHISPLIRPNIIYNDSVKEESKYLLEKLWEVISSELSPELQSIGIPWWFNLQKQIENI